MDTDLFNSGLHLDSMLVGGERSTELTNQMTSMSELRGLCSAPEESFVRPVLSGEELYRKYPHLREMLTSSSEAPSEQQPLSTSTVVQSVQRSDSSLTVEASS
ncbi:hypothetical protein V5799_025917 [Amblyomma americanum]|uniref:Uncharacterized protein n=1 Tax=Amblyomma americanum TaxID=6943 RepID=A0AAQ4DK26_AMBAM